MSKLLFGGIILIICLLGGTYLMIGDSFKFGEDMINNLTLLGAFCVITITVFVSLKYVNQMKNDKANGELSEHTWDGIGEYKNDIPTGWGILFIGTILWLWVYFLFLWPTNEFSQIGQYNDEVKAYNAKFEDKFKNLSDEEKLVDMGQSLYLVNCAVCHGVDAEGIDGKAANLTHRISAKSVEHVIRNGANNFEQDFPGGMPMGLLWEEKDIKQVSEYVGNGFKGPQPEGWQNCTACHGNSGAGSNPMFISDGETAPNLREFTDSMMRTVLVHGKKGAIGVMPSFDGRLNDTQMKALAHYIRSIQGE